MKIPLPSMKVYSIIVILSGLLLSTWCSIAVHGEDVADLISSGEASSSRASNEASKLIDNLRNKARQEYSTPSRALDSLEQEIGREKKNPSSQTSTSFRTKSSLLDQPRLFPKQETLKDIHLPHEGKRKCKDNGSKDSAKCPSSLLQGLEKKQALTSNSNPQLLVFVSQSVPVNAIKELWNQVQRVGGKLLLRGLIGGSFKETQQYIQELGVVVDIDPTKFDEFEVTQVPTFVLSKSQKYDKMVGNVTLIAFLEQAQINGECKETAAKVYKKLEGVLPLEGAIL